MTSQSPGRPAPHFRRLLQLNRPYRLHLLAAALLALAGAGLALVVPLGLRELVDAVFESGDRGRLDRLGIVLAILFLVQATIAFSGQFLLAWTGERIVADFRTRVFAHLQRQSLRFFDGRRTGELTSRLGTDVATVRSALTESLCELLTGSVRLVGSVVLIVAINWRLSLLILVMLPASAALSRNFGARYGRISRQVQDLQAEASAIAQEVISAIRVVLAFSRQRQETERYRSSVEALFRTATRRAALLAVFAATLSALFFGAIAAIFWFGGREVLAGRLTAGDLVATLMYAMNLSTAMGGLAAHYSALAGARGASERLFEILDTEPEVRDPVPGILLTHPRGEVQLDRVTFGYDPAHPVLRDVSLSARPGEVVAIVGPSGSGKTTLLNLIPRFFDPDAGRVLVDGTDVRHLRLEALREQIAIVSQDVQLFNGTLEMNIRYGDPDASPERVRRAAEAANAHSFIESLPDGYGTLVGERGVKLSGGQRQRIAIARALLRDAPILLLDEATSSLDSDSESLIKEALELLRENRTVLVVAHRLSTVRDADQILVLQEGSITQRGTHAELISSSDIYRGFAARQFAVPAPTS